MLLAGSTCSTLVALTSNSETSFTMTEEIDLMLKIGNHENIIRLLGTEMIPSYSMSHTV